MSPKANYYKIGLFVLAAAAAMTVTVLVLGAGKLFRKRIIAETYINESVHGLDVGSPVKYRGVRIGRVREIDFVHTEYLAHDMRHRDIRHVLVRIDLYLDAFSKPSAVKLKEFLSGEIEEGLRVKLSAQGITGTFYLEVDYVDPERNPPLKTMWQPKYYYIPSAPSTIQRLGESVEKVFNRLEKTNVERLVNDMTTFFSKATVVVEEADVPGLRKEAGDLLAELRRTNRRISEILSNPGLDKVAGDVSGAMGAVEEAAGNIDSGLKPVLSELRETSSNLTAMTDRMNRFLNAGRDDTRPLENMAATLENFKQASDGMPELVARLNHTVQRLDRLISGEREALKDTLENLRVFARNLKDLTEQANTYPAHILFGDPPEPKERKDK